MTATTLPRNEVIRMFTREDLQARKSVAISELVRRFGSLEHALEREHCWDYDDETADLFTEYHAMLFLLDEG